MLDLRLSCASVRRRHRLHLQVLRRSYRLAVHAQRQRRLQHCVRLVVHILLLLHFETITDFCVLWHVRRILDNMIPIENIAFVNPQWLGKCSLTDAFTDCKDDEEQSIKCAVNQTQAWVVCPNESDACIGSQALKFQVYTASLSAVPLNSRNQLLSGAGHLTVAAELLSELLSQLVLRAKSLKVQRYQFLSISWIFISEQWETIRQLNCCQGTTFHSYINIAERHILWSGGCSLPHWPLAGLLWDNIANKRVKNFASSGVLVTQGNWCFRCFHPTLCLDAHDAANRRKSFLTLSWQTVLKNKEIHTQNKWRGFVETEPFLNTEYERTFAHSQTFLKYDGWNKILVCLTHNFGSCTRWNCAFAKGWNGHSWRNVCRCNQGMKNLWKGNPAMRQLRCNQQCSHRVTALGLHWAVAALLQSLRELSLDATAAPIQTQRGDATAQRRRTHRASPYKNDPRWRVIRIAINSQLCSTIQRNEIQQNKEVSNWQHMCLSVTSWGTTKHIQKDRAHCKESCESGILCASNSDIYWHENHLIDIKQMSFVHVDFSLEIYIWVETEFAIVSDWLPVSLFWQQERNSFTAFWKSLYLKR